MYTVRDENATHQIIVTASRNSTSISCNCRKTTGEHEKAGKLIFDHMGSVKTFAEACNLYNDPDNHWAPFEEADKIGRGKHTF